MMRKTLILLGVLLFFTVSCNLISVWADPVVNAVSGNVANGQVVTISGADFGPMNGKIVSWDDFEKHPSGQRIPNTKPIIGPDWTCIYNYNGDGARYDNKHVHSGGVAAHLDWSIDQYTIRAFGWNRQGPFDRLYISYWRYMEGDFNASCNHKQFYLYGNSDQMPQAMPIIPPGTNVWGFYNNVGDPSIPWSERSNINTAGWTYDNKANQYNRWEFWLELNQPYTASNGIIKVWVDGELGIDTDSYRLRYVDGEYIDFRLGHMAQKFSSTAKAWFDDLYIATTRARVEIGNAPVFDACTHREVQIFNDWRPDSVTATIHTGTFQEGETAYLFIIDGQGNASAGHEIVIAESGVIDPDIYTLTVQSGTGGGRYPAGTTVTINADDPDEGRRFARWIGDTDALTDVQSEPTTLVMPAHDIQVTATYTDDGTPQTPEKPIIKVIASGNQDPNVPSNTVDGDPETRWSEKGTEDVWIRFDLGSEQTVNNVRLAWFYGDTRSAYFDIDVSSNGSDYKTVYANGQSSGTTTGLESYTFDPVAARYVRVNCYGNSNSQWNSILEAKVFGTDGGSQAESILVDWGESADSTRYGFSNWNNAYTGYYTSHNADGPAGIVGSWSARYCTAGVYGSPEYFDAGDRILVTWYNRGTSGTLTFTPKVSFDDPDAYQLGTSGTWFDMSELTLSAGQAGTTAFVFDADCAGSYSRVHVCRGLDGGQNLLQDKIVLEKR